MTHLLPMQRPEPNPANSMRPRALSMISFAVIVGVCSCEYNGEVRVRVPRWETSTAPLGVLGVHPIGSAPAGGPYSPTDCEATPSRVALSFFIADERDAPVKEGGRIRIVDDTSGESYVVRPTAEMLAAPDAIFVDGVTLLVDGTDSESLTAQVESAAWIPTGAASTDGAALPERLVLIHDHGNRSGQADPTDARITALTELVEEFLCTEDAEAINCPYPADASVALYRIFEDSVEPRLPATRDQTQITDEITLIREDGEQGQNSPLFQGLDRGLGECSGAGSGSDCWPAVVLIAAGDPDPAPQIGSIPDGGRIFVAGLSDSPALRRAACQTGGFFELLGVPDAVRLITNRSTSEIPDFDYGFARRSLMATAGRWEVILSLGGVPTDLDMSTTHRLSGTLTVTLGRDDTRTGHTELVDFQAVIGGY